MACKGNKQVFHGKKSSLNDFFFAYACLFHEMFVRLPFNEFNMDMLRILNIPPTQLHPNSQAYMHTFLVICQVLYFVPTVATFLHYFQTRPVGKYGWVSFISKHDKTLFELFVLSFKGFMDKFFKIEITKFGHSCFFNEDCQPKFPLYWTQNPARLTFWSIAKMTSIEQETFDIIDNLPVSCPPENSLNVWDGKTSVLRCSVWRFFLFLDVRLDFILAKFFIFFQ